MVVLGIDPGIAITGYGLIREDFAGSPQLVIYGTIDATAVSPNSSRLLFLYENINHLLEEYVPDACAIEKLFFQKNVKTAMAVSEARGVIALCLAQHGYQAAEYTPNEVKLSITSYGNAGKAQVQEMVRTALNMDTIPRPDDAADALAIALCHFSTLNFRRLLEQSHS